MHINSESMKDNNKQPIKKPDPSFRNANNMNQSTHSDTFKVLETIESKKANTTSQIDIAINPKVRTPKKTLDALLRNLDVKSTIKEIGRTASEVIGGKKVHEVSNKKITLVEDSKNQEGLNKRKDQEKINHSNSNELHKFNELVRMLADKEDTMENNIEKNSEMKTNENKATEKKELLALAGFTNYLKNIEKYINKEKEITPETKEFIVNAIKQEVRDCFKKLILPQISTCFNELNSQVLTKYEKLSKGIINSAPKTPTNYSNNSPNENEKRLTDLIHKQKHLKILQTEPLFKLLDKRELLILFVETCDINNLLTIESKRLFELLKLTHHIFEADHFVFGILSFLNVYSLNTEECKELKNILVLINQGVWFINDGPPVQISDNLKNAIINLKNSIIRKLNGTV